MPGLEAEKVVPSLVELYLMNNRIADRGVKVSLSYPSLLALTACFTLLPPCNAA